MRVGDGGRGALEVLAREARLADRQLDLLEVARVVDVGAGAFAASQNQISACTRKAGCFCARHVSKASRATTDIGRR